MAQIPENTSLVIGFVQADPGQATEHVANTVKMLRTVPRPDQDRLLKELADGLGVSVNDLRGLLSL